MKKFLLSIALLLALGSQAQAQTATGINVSGAGSGSGGGTTIVTSFPATFVAGSSYYNSVTNVCVTAITTTSTVPCGASVMTSPSPASLGVEYLFLPSETAASALDYSGKGKNIAGSVGTAPLIISGTGGVNFIGTGALLVPTSLNTTIKTWMAYVCYVPSAITIPTAVGANTSPVAQAVIIGNGGGTTAGAAGLIYRVQPYTADAANAGTNPILRSLGPANTFETTSESVPNGCGMVTWSMDAGGDRLFMGPTESQYSVQASTAGLNTTQWQLGGATVGSGYFASTYIKAKIYLVLGYTDTITNLGTSIVAQNANWMNAVMTSRGVAPGFTATGDGLDQVAIEGDSLEGGLGPFYMGMVAPPGGYGNYTTNQLSFQLNTQAISGTSSTQMAARFPLDVGPIIRAGASRNLCIFWGGTNISGNALTTVGDMENEATQCHAKGAKFMVVSMISRTGEDTCTYPTVCKDVLNPVTRQLASSSPWVDRFLDLAMDPNIGCDGCNTNGYFNSDHIHLTSTLATNGHQVVGLAMVRGINAVFGNNTFASANTYTTAPIPAATTPMIQNVDLYIGGGLATQTGPSFPIYNVKGNSNICFITWSGASTLTSMTDTLTNTYTDTVTVSNGSSHMAWGYTLNMAQGGQNVITFNLSGTSTAMGYACQEFYLPNATLDVTGAGATGTSSAPTSAVTTTKSSDFIFFGASYAGVAFQNWVKGTGFTLLCPVSVAGNGGCAEYSMNNAAGTYNPAITSGGSAAWEAQAISFYNNSTVVQLQDYDVKTILGTIGANTTANLPDCLYETGQRREIKNLNTAAFLWTVAAINSETIDGVTSFVSNNLTDLEFESVPAAQSTGGCSWKLTKNQSLATLTNCAAIGTGASPSVVSCGSAQAGVFSCATNATGATCQINTTAVSAQSIVQVEEDDTTATGTRLGVTCNTSTTVIPTSRLIASQTAGTGFVINLGTVTTNPACFTYTITN